MPTSRTARLLLLPLLCLFAPGCDEEMSPAEVHRRKGHDLVREGKFEEAAKAYAESLKADPKQEAVWEQKAFALMKAGQTDEAAEALLKSAELKVEPAKKLEAYRNVAGMYLKSQTPEKSEAYFLKVLELAPKDEQAMTWLGELFSQLGGARSNDAKPDAEMLKKAIAWYDKVVEVNPASVTALVNKRIALSKLAQSHQQAISDQEATKRDNRRDKTILADADAAIARHNADLAALKQDLDRTTALLSEAMKKQNAAKKP